MVSLNSLFDLRNKVALVTGASSGLGRRAAIVLSAAGAKVIGVARRRESLEELRKEIGNNFSFFVGDVAQRDNMKSLLSEASKEVGMPDILVHAAGLNPRQTAHEVTSEEWDKTLEINLSAPFFLSRAAISVMKERGWGRIVNFASLQSTRAFPGGLAYGASKGGIVQLTRAMAEEWSGDGICVNAIGPDFFPTELTKAVFDDAERAERNAMQTCIGRNGKLEDIDGPLLFLCSEASAYVTGQVLMVDGGFTAK